MIVYPNAKINIGLNITRKRDDGYHEISSVFYPVKDLYDVLEILPSEEFLFCSSGIEIPSDINICEQAFNLLQQDFKIGNVKIHLHKQIPIGAGLGGGSSNAAFTLKVLNILFSLKLSTVQLEQYALKLGADCPFFIDNSPKYVRGIGEKMTPIDLDLSVNEIRFIFPELIVSSSDAYKLVNPKEVETNLLEIITEPMESWKKEIKNDFEAVIFKKYPQLEEMKKQLYTDGAIYASMTGSGSVIFAIF